MARPFKYEVKIFPERKCNTCGKKFISRYTTDYLSRHPRFERFCSKPCGYASRNSRVELSCGICSKKIVIFKSELKYGRGKFCSKKCSGKFHSGVNSQVYKHGLTPEREKIRGLPEYRAWRTSVFIRDGKKCVWCESTKSIQADHIKPQALYPELRYDINNGRTLCHDCHKKTPSYGNTNLTKEQFESLMI